MKLKVLSFALLINFTSVCQSLNILGIFPYQGKSHFFVFRVYLEELARRGHQVTVISHFPTETPVNNNYKDISLVSSGEIVENNIVQKNSYLVVMLTGLYLAKSGVEDCDTMLENKGVQELWKSGKKFDVVVTEQFNSDCSLGLAYKLGSPVVALNSHILMPWHYNRFGTPYNPSYVSFHFLEGGTKPTLFQRVERTIFDVYFKLLYKFMSQRGNQNTLAKYFDDIPPLEDLAKEIKFLLLYTNFPLTGSRLFPANVIEVGGYHIAKPKPVSGDLAKFIEQSEHGVIYISFGSIVKSASLPKEQFESILEAVSELPQRVVWKHERPEYLLKYKNIFASKWLPQNDILAHPKTLAFFSHGGNLGTTEAIHNAVPVVSMPALGDQPANSAAIEESGLGVQVQFQDLTKETLLEALKTILKPEFRKQVKELSKVWHDRPISALDTAIYWTEFAVKHKNHTFRTAAADVPLYQYLCLDVLAVLGVIATLVVLITAISISHFTQSKLKAVKKPASKAKSKKH